MGGLGRLERAVMDALWDMAAAEPGAVFTVRDVAETLPRHAYTTILTVVGRLTSKGLVERIRDGKTHHFRPTGTRESYVAELMQEALAATPDVDGALIRFVETVPAEQARLLGDVLRRLEGSNDGADRDEPSP
jgi:predicted transcriptional regulator